MCYVEIVDAIGLRELRQNASELIRRVEAGDSLTVTVAGRPAALLVPAALARVLCLVCRRRISAWRRARGARARARARPKLWNSDSSWKVEQKHTWTLFHISKIEKHRSWWSYAKIWKNRILSQKWKKIEKSKIFQKKFISTLNSRTTRLICF